MVLRARGRAARQPLRPPKRRLPGCGVCVGGRVRACVRVCARLRASERASERVCVCMCVCVLACRCCVRQLRACLRTFLCLGELVGVCV